MTSPSKTCTPLHLVKIGSLVTPRFFLTNDAVRHLDYANQCADIGGGLVAGTARLEVIEVSPMALNTKRWIKLAMVGTDPPKVLQLSAEEYMSKFHSIS